MSDPKQTPLTLSPRQRDTLAKLLPLYSPPITLSGHTALVSPSNRVSALRNWRTAPTERAERTEALEAFLKACQVDTTAHFQTIRSIGGGCFRNHPATDDQWRPLPQEAVYGLALIAGQMCDNQYLGLLLHERNCPAEVVDFIVRNQQFSGLHNMALNSETCSREIAKAVLLGEVPGCDPGAAIYTRALPFQEVRSLIEEAPSRITSQRLGGDMKAAIPLLAGRDDAPADFLRDVAPAIAKLEGETPPEYIALEKLTKNADAQTLAVLISHATTNLPFMLLGPRAKELTTDQIFLFPQIRGFTASDKMRYLASDYLFSKAIHGVTQPLPWGAKLACVPGAAIGQSDSDSVVVEIDSFRIEVEGDTSRDQSRLRNTTIHLLGCVMGTERRVRFEAHTLDSGSLLGVASAVASAIDDKSLKQGTLGV